MKYFFILGRNPELSRAEVYSYLEARNISYKEEVYEQNILILYLDSKLNLDINDFGGVIMLGEILLSGTKSEVLELIKKEELIPEEKFTFNIIGNYDLEQEIYQKFKEEKRKAMLRHGRGQLKVQGEDIIDMPNADFHFFCFKHNTINFGLVSQIFSAKDQKYRDMKKPVRREELAISPRLAKILINLSQVKPGDKLLDPFCGIGGILQESLLLKIKSFGIDQDARAIKDARKNLDWIKKEFKSLTEYELLNLDSRNTPFLNFDGIATESNLGELTKRKLKEREADDFLDKFEQAIIPILRRLKKVKKPNARIAITFPFIRDKFVNLNKIMRETDLRLGDFNNIKFPIKEFRKDQFVSREIFVFV